MLKSLSVLVDLIIYLLLYYFVNDRIESNDLQRVINAFHAWSDPFALPAKQIILEQRDNNTSKCGSLEPRQDSAHRRTSLAQRIVITH